MASSGTAPRPAARATLLPWLGALLVLGVTSLAMGPWPVGIFLDDGIYTVLARSLAEGSGYRYLNLPGAPEATHYPPGYPALLALLWRAWPEFPANVVLLKGANAVLMALAVPGLAALARRRFDLPPLVAVAVAALLSLAIPLLTFATTLFSEPLFLALLGPALLVAERAATGESRRDAFAGGLLCGALFLVRTVGAGAGLALVAMLAWRRRFVAAALAAGGLALCVLPWQLWVAAHDADLPRALVGKYGSYSGWLMDGWREGGAPFLLASIRRTVESTWTVLGVLFAPTPLRAIAALSTVTALACFALGARRIAWRAPVTAGFLAFYLAIVLVWPFAPYRFIWGVWPLLGLVAAAGAVAVWRWRPAVARGLPRHAALACVLLAAGGHLLYNARGYARRNWEPLQRAESEAALTSAGWIARHVPRGAVVASEYGPLVWLYTGRLAVPTGSLLAREYVTPLTVAESAEESRGILELYGVQYYVVAARGTGGEAPARYLMSRTPPALVLIDTLSNGGAAFAPVR
jgi:hypothetical protein